MWWENWGLQAVKFSSSTWMMFIQGCKHDILYTFLNMTEMCIWHALTLCCCWIRFVSFWNSCVLASPVSLRLPTPWETFNKCSENGKNPYTWSHFWVSFSPLLITLLSLHTFICHTFDTSTNLCWAEVDVLAVVTACTPISNQGSMGLNSKYVPGHCGALVYALLLPTTRG